MSTVYGTYGPRWPRLGKFIDGMLRSFYRFRFRRKHVHTPESQFAQESLKSLREKLERGETAYLVGIGPSSHNTGVALISLSQAEGIQLLSNDEEERFTADKHCDTYPAETLAQLKVRMDELGLTTDDIHAWIANWNFPVMPGMGIKHVFEEFPRGFKLLNKENIQQWDFAEYCERARQTPAKLAEQFGTEKPIPLICQPHHDNHAAFSFAVSPFRDSNEPVMVSVLDGFGDEGAISLYVTENGQLKPLQKNYSLVDSLGAFYSNISSTQGGWTIFSSEGRYMGAVAWGDQNRLTNPFYKPLREIFHLGPNGEVKVNRTMINWHVEGTRQPYGKPLVELLGKPISADQMWNPDAVLNVEDVEHSEITTRRVDIAAATQLVFEDVVFHLVEHLIRTTGSHQLVMTGGTALNCLVNMNLLEHFNREWYQRNLNKDACLHLWVPPIPGDAGVILGGAYNFAMKAGAKSHNTLAHAFHCGAPPQTSAIEAAFANEPEVDFKPLGNVNSAEGLESVTDLMAFLVSRGGAVGIYQGSAETGPRALGHRSILANPCHPDTLKHINSLVKFREPIRPLAPMATLDAAQELFHLAEGASDDDYNAYNYMVLTTLARDVAYEKVPAVIHKDGTARVQIVREETDPVCYAYLRAMERRLGVAVSVNTSLNVGSPIVQHPPQAIETLKRAKALTALILIGDDGSAFLSWCNQDVAPKDGGRQLLEWYTDWETERKLEPTQSASSKPSNA